MNKRTINSTATPTTCQKTFSIHLANCRSAAPKLDEIRATCSASTIDVFACTESWLNPLKHTDCDIYLPNFQIFRQDRIDSLGGGVLLYVRDCFRVTRIAMPGLPPCGIDCVCISIPEINTFFLCTYIPIFYQSSVINVQINDFFTQLIDNLLKNQPDSYLILCGDFNQYDVTNLCSSLDLIDLHSPPTRELARLDRFLVSCHASSLCTIKLGPPIGNSDHNSLLCTLIADIKRTTKFTRVFDLRDCHIDHFLKDLNNADWTVLYCSNSADTKCELFHSILSQAMRTIPTYNISLTSKDKPWITPLIKHLINKRWSAFRSRNYETYLRLKLLIRSKITQAKIDWSSKLSSPSDLWEKVNAINSRNRNHSLENLYNSFFSIEDLTNTINVAFSKSFKDRLCTQAEFDKLLQCSNSINSPWDLHITEEQISEAFNSYDSRKSHEPDYVPTLLYKKSCHIICKPLAHIFNHCISTSSFPKIWKHAHVIPVPKNSNPSIQELRPISLLSLPSKIFERFIFTSVSYLFYDHFDSNQFGFRPNSSTCCALIKLHDHITQKLDSDNVSGVQVIALDYQKAFDSLDHKAIMSKLINCKFPISFIKLMFSYLQNRSQSVRLNSVISKPCIVTSGIPQGSIIGPSIFSLVMSDLKPVDSNTCMTKFADDITLSIPIFFDSNHVMAEINNITTWSNPVGLDLNLKKCKYIFISSSSCGSPFLIPDFTYCDKILLLGVYFCNNLKWDMHFSHIRSVCSKRLYALRTLKSTLTVSELRNVYMSLIVSLIEYCSALFVGMTDQTTDIIKGIQRRFHNIICYYNCHCKTLPDLLSRRNSSSVNLYLAASQHYHILHDIIPSKRTWFQQPHSNTERRKRSFIPYTTELVNNLIRR